MISHQVLDWADNKKGHACSFAPNTKGQLTLFKVIRTNRVSRSAAKEHLDFFFFLFSFSFSCVTNTQNRKSAFFLFVLFDTRFLFPLHVRMSAKEPE